jgi:hypothetical protein
MDDLKAKRKKLILEIDIRRKELFGVEKQLTDEGILDDPSLIMAIESAKKAYDKGNFGAIKKLALKMMERLDNDVFFMPLTREALDEHIKIVARDPTANIYQFPDEVGGKMYRCQYGLPVVVGAPPKGRKTTFAINVMYRDMMRGINSLFCTFELTPQQVMFKLFQIHIRVKSGIALDIESIPSYIDGTIKLDWLDIPAMYKEFADIVFHHGKVIECSGYGVERLCAVIERCSVDFDPKVVHIDYFQRIKNKNQDDTRVGFMNNSRFLTEKCKEMKAVFLVLSQLNFEGHFKETNALEEDAGLALALENRVHELLVKVKAARFTEPFEFIFPLCKTSGTILG